MKRHALVASLLAFSLVGAAQATSSVVATLSNLRITTTGTVTPQPGVTHFGSIPVDIGTTKAFTSAQTYDAVFDSADKMTWGNGLYESHEEQIDVTKGQTLEDLSAPVSKVSSATTQAHGRVNDDLSLFASVSTNEKGGQAFASASILHTFWLAPNSSITATWDTSVTGGNSGDRFALSYLDSATGAAGATTFEDYSMMPHYTLGIGRPVDGSGTFLFEKHDNSRTLTSSTTDTGRLVSLRVEVFASTYDYTGNSLPVPEPETWAMALLGLALVGVKARRRPAD
jgi:MYXO-CTERM domain-containing protein